MNFQQLQYILAVEKFKNFNRAALSCEVAQSTLSKEIQRLEKEYDIIIFDRTRNPVVPTLKGLDLLKKSREILSKKREFVDIAVRRNNEVAGRIRLAISEILAPYITPLFIRKITKRYPNLELQILELSDRHIEDQLISEEIDAAIMISPSLSHDYFEYQLYEEEIVLYSTHKINLSKDCKINSNLVDYNSIFIHQDIKGILKRQLNRVFGASSITKKININYQKGNLETIRNVINYNGGTMLLPKIAIHYFPSNHKKYVYSITDPKPKLNVRLVSSRGFEKTRIVKRLIEQLKMLIPTESSALTLC
ncbi:MAG: LysR family transcriptional regulator [Bacteroidota bacterium]